VQVLQSQHQFSDIEPRSLLTETSFFLEMPEQFPTTFEIRYEVEVCIGLEAKLETNEEWRV
jgi:hypothetical protein